MIIEKSNDIVVNFDKKCKHGIYLNKCYLLTLILTQSNQIDLHRVCQANIPIKDCNILKSFFN